MTAADARNGAGTTTGFRKLEEREVYRGARIALAEAEFESPDGERFQREIVHHPGAVAVVPVVDEGTAVLLVRQYRAPLDRAILEIPAGLRDAEGEPPIETARRELAEEVGMRAGRIERLGEFANSPGFCDEVVHLYVAFDLEPCGTDLQGIEEQHMTVEKVPLGEAAAMVRAGELVDAKTIIGLALTRDLLETP